jgi:hypothetical protein
MVAASGGGAPVPNVLVLDLTIERVFCRLPRQGPGKEHA